MHTRYSFARTRFEAVRLSFVLEWENRIRSDNKKWNIFTYDDDEVQITAIRGKPKARASERMNRVSDTKRVYDHLLKSMYGLFPLFKDVRFY